MKCDLGNICMHVFAVENETGCCNNISMEEEYTFTNKYDIKRVMPYAKIHIHFVGLKQ